MKFLKMFFLVVIASSAMTNLYPDFKDITHLFPEPHHGSISVLPINGNSSEKLFFVYDSNHHLNNRIPLKIKIFHLNSDNIVIKEDEGQEGAFYISTNKDPTHPLAIFKYLSDIGTYILKRSEIVSWDGNKLITIPYFLEPWEYYIGSIFSHNSSLGLIFWIRKILNQEKFFQLNQSNEVIKSVLSKKLKHSEVIAINHNLTLVVYNRYSHTEKKHKHKYKCPALLQLHDDHCINLSDQYPDLKKLKRLRSAYLIMDSPQLMVYGITLKDNAAFYLLDQETKQIVEFTDACGLKANDLINIDSINFSNGSSLAQLMCIIYKNEEAKLFWFKDRSFTDITQSSGIDGTVLSHVTSVNLIQDFFGTTISINRNLGDLKCFCIFHDPEMHSLHGATAMKRAINQ